MQATMFEPVGGMDQIPIIIERNLKSRASRNAGVRRIRQTGKRVTVEWTDGRHGTQGMTRGDYLVCTLPFPVLARIDGDFAAPVKAAIGAVEYDYSNKIAFDAPRFWEA